MSNVSLALASVTFAVIATGAAALVFTVIGRAQRNYRKREARRLRAKYGHLRAVDVEAPNTFWPESPTANYTDSFRNFYND